jgi:hypothetical protein
MNEMWVREENGDYFFTYVAANLSEEGLFLQKRLPSPDQEPYSRYTFSLPNGKVFRGLTGRIVREQKLGAGKGAGVQFLNLPEHVRIALRQFILEKSALVNTKIQQN